MRNKIILTILFLVSAVFVYSQDAYITYNTPVCQSSSTQFYGAAENLTATSFTFNGGSLPAGWTSSPYTVGSPCDPPDGPSPDGTSYFWATTRDGNGDRFVRTAAVDVSYGGEIIFYLRYGNDDPDPGCENLDASNEYVILQYSTNGGASYTNIYSFPINASMYVWDEYTFTIPAGAQTSSTMFRWFQDASSGDQFDNWGIENVNVTATPGVTSWSWNFGDGGTSSSQNPTHVFNSSGNHTVTLDVVFVGGATAQDIETVYVNPKPATPTLNLTQSPVCQEVSGFALTGGSPTTGGAYSGTGVSSNNFYPSSAGPGDHTISYRVSSGGCWSDATTDIMHVNPTPTVTFGTVTPNPVHLYQGATLGGGTPSGGTYSGTGVSGTTYSPTSTGTKTLYYTYVDANTCTATASQNISVIDNAPVVTINQSPVPTYYMLTSPVVLFPDLTITDSDGGNVDVAYVYMGTNHNTAADSDNLYFTNTANITGSYNASSGWLTLTGPATVEQFQAALRSVTYANTGSAFPEETRTINVIVQSNTGGFTSGSGSVNIVPNQRPVAVNDSYDVYEDNYILSVAADGVLSNDYDPDAFDVIHAVLEGGPSHAASFNLNANGSFSYEPVDGYVGTDSFTYYANDTKVNSLTPATVTIYVLHPTWDGVGDWSDASKWNGTIDPSEALDSVLINNGTVTVGTANAQVRVLTLTANGNFQAQNGYYLQIDDALRNNMRRVISLNSPMQVRTSVQIPMDSGPTKSDTDMICVSESSMLHINGTYFLDSDGIFKKDASRIGYRNGQWEIWDERVNGGKSLFTNPAESNQVPLNNWSITKEATYTIPILNQGSCK